MGAGSGGTICDDFITAPELGLVKVIVKSFKL